MSPIWLLHYQWVDHSASHLKLSLVVPRCRRSDVLKLANDNKTLSHLREEKTYLRLKRSFFWPSMSVDCKLYVGCCGVCARNKKPKTKPKASLGTFHTGTPMDCVHIDILGPLVESHNGNSYILVCIDQFTKWIECFALPDQTAELVARKALEEFFCRLGIPVHAADAFPSGPPIREQAVSDFM